MTCLLPLRRPLPGLGEQGAPPSRCQPGRHGSQSRLHLQTSSRHAFKSKAGMCYLNSPPVWCIWIWSALLHLSKYFYNHAKRSHTLQSSENESFRNTCLKIQQDLELLQDLLAEQTSEQVLRQRQSESLTDGPQLFGGETAGSGDRRRSRHTGIQR